MRKTLAAAAKDLQPGAVDFRRRAVTACPSPDFFERLRRRASLNRPLSLSLARHLSRPCTTCLDRLAELPPLVDDAGNLRDKLPDSMQALIRALRLLGGWPPRAWLRADRRRALDEHRRQGGFLYLVLEMARNIPWAEQETELEVWLDALLEDGLDISPWLDDAHPTRALLARGYAFLAFAQHRNEHRDAALDAFECASLLAEGFPEDGMLAVLLLETYGQMIEDRGSDVAESQYELALDRLAFVDDALRRAEILLRLARNHLRVGATHDARHHAERALACLEGERSRLVERSICHVRTLATLIDVECQLDDLPRAVAASLLRRGAISRSRVAFEIDPELWKEAGTIAARLETTRGYRDRKG